MTDIKITGYDKPKLHIQNNAGISTFNYQKIPLDLE